MDISKLANNEELNEIVKKTLGIKPNEKIEVLTKKSTVEVSNTITSLHNAFNKIYAHTLNVKNIQVSEEKRLRNIKKEVTMESRARSASLTGGPDISIGNLPDIFMSLSSSIQGLNKNLDKLDMSVAPTTELDVDDIDRRRRRGGRGRPRSRIGGRGMRMAGRGLGGAGIFLDVGGRVSEGESAGQIAAGVGGGVAGGVVGAKAGALAGGAIGAFFGGVGAAPGAAIGGVIGGIGGYLGGGFVGDKAYGAAQSRGAQRQLENAATRVTRQGKALERATPIGSTSFSSRFADFINQSITNMSLWAAAQTALSAVGNFFGGGGGDGGGGAGSSQNADTAMAYFMSQGWTREQAAGIVGNLQAESGRDLDPSEIGYNDVRAGVHSYGIAQWNRDRWEGLQSFAQNKGTSPTDFQTQLEYVQHEFNTTKRNAARALRATNTPADAASIVDQLYEVSTGEHRDRRIANAQALFGGGSVDRAAGGTGRLTSGFGMRIHPISRVRTMHHGIDIAAPTGTPVAAAYAGQVTVARSLRGYGKSVYIRHPGGYVTRYAHLSSISVREGASVAEGARIGAVGSTGASTGSHLHYELIDETGTHRNPIESYRRRPWIVGGQFMPPTPNSLRVSSPASIRQPNPMVSLSRQNMLPGQSLLERYSTGATEPAPSVWTGGQTFMETQTRRGG